MHPSFHKSFANVALKTNFKIDDLIAGLEKNRDGLYGNLKADQAHAAEQIETYIAQNRPWYTFGTGFEAGYKNLKLHQDACLAAKHLKEAGVEHLELDLRKDLIAQILEIGQEKLKADTGAYPSPRLPNCS